MNAVNTRDPLISIIIRSKNEEQWIAACLSKIAEQTIQSFEVILVDNGSTDKTIQRAYGIMPDIRVVNIGEFFPGRAINEGIRASSGEYIVCLSSHCVPQKLDWLQMMYENFVQDKKLAGVYGRQIPMHFSNPLDVRDLFLTFGLDKRTQFKDPFFHNANSMFPRAVWDIFPFDETVTNIEDRVWAKTVLSAGYHIVYEPEAAVFHHHGIHHNGNIQRAKNIIKIMEPDLASSYKDTDNPLHPEKLNITAILTVREDSSMSDKARLKMLEKTLHDVQESSYTKRIVVSTDSLKLQDQAKYMGACVPFLRPSKLAESGVRTISVLQHALQWLEEEENIFSDYIVLAEITHPFRPTGFIDRCIDAAIEKGLETVLAGVPEFRPCWWLDQDEYKRIDDSISRRDTREPVLIGLPALCCVTLPSLIRDGRKIGKKLGIISLEDSLSALQIRDEEDFRKFSSLIEAGHMQYALEDKEGPFHAS